MYKDALEIWRGHPIIGAGAGGWEALYEQAQSYPYISVQTHGFVTQLLVEVGLLGLIVYVGFIAVVIWTYLRFYWKASESERNRYSFYFIVPMTILIHAAIDFEMSYILYLAIVFLCLGVMAGTQRQPACTSIRQKSDEEIQLGGFDWICSGRARNCNPIRQSSIRN